MKILELGCGHGALIRFLNERGYGNVWGVDASREQVEEARRLGSGDVRQGDLLATLRSQAAASQDVVVAFDVIEHMRKEEVVEFVDEIARVLRPGGRWVIHSANAESPFGGRSFFGDFTHETFFTRVSIGQLLFCSGFEAVSCNEDAPVVHGVKSALRRAGWSLIRLILRLCVLIETGACDRACIFSQNFLVVATKKREGQ